MFNRLGHDVTEIMSTAIANEIVLVFTAKGCDLPYFLRLVAGDNKDI